MCRVYLFRDKPSLVNNSSNNTVHDDNSSNNTASAPASYEQHYKQQKKTSFSSFPIPACIRYEPSWQALAEKQQQRKEESEAAAAAAAASANGSGAAAANGTIGVPNGVGGGAVGFACAGNGAVGGDGASSATGQQNRSNTKQRRRRADKVRILSFTVVCCLSVCLSVIGGDRAEIGVPW